MREADQVGKVGWASFRLTSEAMSCVRGNVEPYVVLKWAGEERTSILETCF